MKYSVKKTGLLILAAVLLCTAAAAAGCITQEELHAPEEMVGTWYAEDNDNIYYITTKGDNAGVTFTITGRSDENGDGDENGWDVTNFLWTVDSNGVFKISYDGGEIVTGTPGADKQTITLDGGLVMYKISDIKTETVNGKTVIQKEDPVVGIWKGVGVTQVLQFSPDNKGIYSDETSKKFTWEKTDRIYKLTFEDGTTEEAYHNADETLTCMKTTYVKMSDI